ncbi:DUF2510 domain-containing protein [Aeromicrobium sp. UC242_57]|uniref:DUF2510 domain-containing protein n=1 Tax=Aeromicrobium sp. UC242_57 TaxID=3374624 RepID=UPI0037A11B6C
MNLPPAAWYPDPSRRRELRFWDGTQWTEHVASAGTTGVDPLPQPALLPSRRPRRSRHLGWLGLVVIALAVTFIAVPGVAFARAASSPGVERERPYGGDAASPREVGHLHRRCRQQRILLEVHRSRPRWRTDSHAFSWVERQLVRLPSRSTWSSTLGAGG